MKQSNNLQEKKNIFVYSVWGRTGSTALQRIMNSSREIVIYGEPHHLIDDIIEPIRIIDEERSLFEANYKAFEDALWNEKHDKFYPNALTNLDETKQLLINALATLLRPPADLEINRSGFKEMRIKSIQTLNYLTEIFPNSKTVFIFRNPLTQWNSVEKKKHWWDHEISPHLKAFLEEYERIANIYLNFIENNEKAVFVEHNRIKSEKDIIKLFKFCDLHQFDASLIDDKVGRTQDFTVTDQQREEIMNSNAYTKYKEMKKLSDIFFMPSSK